MRPNRLVKPKNPLYPAGTGGTASVDVDAVLQYQDQLTVTTGQVTGLDELLAAKAPLDSPALTGAPTAPDPPPGDASSALATTAWVAANAGSGGGGTTLTRGTTAVATGSLAPGASDTTLAAALGKSGVLLRVATSRPARVRVYVTAAARTADLSRAVGTKPTGEHGILLDLVTTAATLDFYLSPKVPYSSDETVPASSLPITIQNLDTAAGVVSVTFTKITMEP